MKPLEPLLPGETRSEYLARVDGGKAVFKDTARALTHDQIGRSLEPVQMPEYVKDAIATCYGLLWEVQTTDKRVHKARRGLLQWLTKEEQARGIEMARGLPRTPNTECKICLKPLYRRPRPYRNQ